MTLALSICPVREEFKVLNVSTFRDLTNFAYIWVQIYIYLLYIYYILLTYNILKWFKCTNHKVAYYLTEF